MSKICYFDLETKYTFAEIEKSWDSLSYSQKEAIRGEIIPKMGMATSCVISEDKPKEAIFFDEGDEEQLISTLDSFDTIIGHNLLHFDYFVLSPYYKHDIINYFEKKTIDTLDYLHKRTRKFIKLDDLAKNNLKLEKIMNPIYAPRMWREGHKEEVRKYCRSDVELVREIYLIGIRKKSLFYTDKGLLREVRVEW